jgi:hypothetical protein
MRHLSADTQWILSSFSGYLPATYLKMESPIQAVTDAINGEDAIDNPQMALSGA